MNRQSILNEIDHLMSTSATTMSERVAIECGVEIEALLASLGTLSDTEYYDLYERSEHSEY